MPVTIFKYSKEVHPKDFTNSQLVDANVRAVVVNSFLQQAAKEIAIRIPLEWDEKQQPNILSTEVAIICRTDLGIVNLLILELARQAQLNGDHVSISKLSSLYQIIFGVVLPFNQIAQIPVKSNAAHS